MAAARCSIQTRLTLALPPARSAMERYVGKEEKRRERGEEKEKSRDPFLMVFATAAAREGRREGGREGRLGVLFQRSDKEGRTVAAAAPHVARAFLRSILLSLLQSTGAKTMARMNAPRPRGHSRALAPVPLLLQCLPALLPLPTKPSWTSLAPFFHDPHRPSLENNC